MMSRNTAYIRSRHGFTLLELAIVFMILSLLVGVSVTLGAAQINAARYAQTYSKMDAIEKALLAYRRAYNRLPCPASLTVTEGGSGFGTEAGAAGNCSATGVNSLSGGNNHGMEGAVPVITLGLPGDFMFDGWGQRFDYAVDKNITLANAFATYSYSSAFIGDLEIKDASGINWITTKAIYVLVSFGENALGGYNSTGVQASAPTNTNEEENCNCGSGISKNNIWVQQEAMGDINSINAAYQMGNNNYYFDDIVHYKMRWQLLGYDE